jgi:endonuclease/exonuclease/phosphatase family metal-dependent hydrolase
MKLKISCAILLVFLSTITRASIIKIASINTMCKICDFKKEYGSFNDRLNYLADSVKRHNLDLIGTQEFQSARHVDKLSQLLKGAYLPIFKRGTLYPTTDAVIFVRKDKFEIISSDGAWLGPKAPHFSWGWKKPTLPRRFQWVYLREKASGKKFILVNAHFDNNQKNSLPSSRYTKNFFYNAKMPIIFTADTNTTPDMEGFRNLVGENMQDSFDEAKIFDVYSNGPYHDDEMCVSGMRNWPFCRIDHILISKNSGFEIQKFAVDIYKYNSKRKYLSDHRMVISEVLIK